MKIALPFENNNIFSSFEHAPSFKIYEIENGKIVTMRFVPVNDFTNIKIDVLLCTNINEKAKKLLESKDVIVHEGFSGNADIALRTFIEG